MAKTTLFWASSSDRSNPLDSRSPSRYSPCIYSFEPILPDTVWPSLPRCPFLPLRPTSWHVTPPDNPTPFLVPLPAHCRPMLACLASLLSLVVTMQPVLDGQRAWRTSELRLSAGEVTWPRPLFWRPAPSRRSIFNKVRAASIRSAART
jgi:hypothetical protein